MNNLELLWGVGSMVLVGAGWTVFGYLMGKAPKEGIDVTGLLFICTGIEFLCSGIIACIMGIPQAALSGWLIGFGVLVLCGIVNYFQLEFMSKAMQKGPNGIIWTVTQSGFIFPFAVGIIFFGVPLGWVRGVAFLLIITSLIMFGGKDEKNGNFGNWKFTALLAFLATGVCQILSNLPSYFPEADSIPSMWRTAAFALGLLFGCILVRIRQLRNFSGLIIGQLKNHKVWRMAALGGFSNLIFSFLFLYPGMNILADIDAGAIAYPVMVCSCLLIFEFYSVIFLHEKRSAMQIVALLLCLCGVAGICL